MIARWKELGFYYKLICNECSSVFYAIMLVCFYYTITASGDVEALGVTYREKQELPCRRRLR